MVIRLSSRTSWRALWVAIVRSRRDRQSRIFVLRFGVFLLVVLLYGGYWLLLLRYMDRMSLLVDGILAAFIFCIIAAAKWRQRCEERKQLEADIAEAPAGLRRRLEALARALLAAQHRALGERWLLGNTVPEGHTVIVRQRQLQALREQGVWEELPLPYRDWMAMPDGAWPPELQHKVLRMGETLHTLLWVLALTPELSPREAMLDARSINQMEAALARRAPGLQPAWELRVQRQAAWAYYCRCWTEQVHRGTMRSDSEERAEAMQDWREKIVDGRVADELAGYSTVAELQAPELFTLTSEAAQRWRVLDTVLQLLDEPEGEPLLAAMEDVVLWPFLPEPEPDPEPEPQDPDSVEEAASAAAEGSAGVLGVE